MALQKFYDAARKAKHRCDSRYNSHDQSLLFETGRARKLACVFRREAAGLAALAMDGASLGLEKLSKVSGRPVIKDRAL